LQRLARCAAKPINSAHSKAIASRSTCGCPVSAGRQVAAWPSKPRYRLPR
jgi:hypothetical protein